jgi:hypothetical protein
VLRTLTATILVSCLALVATTRPACAWGWLAHELVTDTAIDRVGGGLGPFFQANRDFMVCYSIVADSWWGNPDLAKQLPAAIQNPEGEYGRTEIGHHFLRYDDEVYRWAKVNSGRNAGAPLEHEQGLALFKKFVAEKGQAALDGFKAKNQWFEGSLTELPAAMFQTAGEVPWIIQHRLADLTAALKAGKWADALFQATLLNHYVGDSHVPLHTVFDYDGNASSNPLVKGIHGRWESGMIERNRATIQEFLKKKLSTKRRSSVAADDVLTLLFGNISESSKFAHELLETDDALLRAAHPELFKAGAPAPTREPGQYTDAYFKALYAKLGADARNRLWRSVEDVAALWTLAWEQAGKPTPPATKVKTPYLMWVDFLNKKVAPFDPKNWPH